MTVDLSSFKVVNAETSSNTKFDNLVQAIQDALNALPLTQIQNGGGSDGQVATLSGGVWTPAAPVAAVVPVVYRKTTEKDVVNTVVETDLLNSEITVAAGALGTTKMLRATLLGDYLNNTGASRTVQVKVKLGGTTLFDSGACLQLVNSASRRSFRLMFEVGNLGLANSQFLAGALELSGAGGAVTGIGNFGGEMANGGLIAAANQVIWPFATNGASAVDTTAGCALVVTAIHSAASVSLSMRLKYASVEVI